MDTQNQGITQKAQKRLVPKYRPNLLDAHEQSKEGACAHGKVVDARRRQRVPSRARAAARAGRGHERAVLLRGSAQAQRAHRGAAWAQPAHDAVLAHLQPEKTDAHGLCCQASCRPKTRMQHAMEQLYS